MGGSGRPPSPPSDRAAGGAVVALECPWPTPESPAVRYRLGGAVAVLVSRGDTSGVLKGMKSYTEDGALVLADISGFTAFVTATELEHGPPIIAALLEEVMRQLSPPLEIQEVEGDAVFALGPDHLLVPRAKLLNALDEAFAAFRNRQRELEADESCSCKACRSVGSLDLKIVVHHGRFLRQLVGGRGQVAGANVILAHQLLKNDLGKRAYLLFTEAALRWIGLDAIRSDLAVHVERYEHLGDVRCFVRELTDPARLTAPAAA